MDFNSDDQNPLIHLVELKTRLAPKDDVAGNHDLLVELRINPDEIKEDKVGTISVKILEAMLSLNFSGLKAVAKTKHGQEETGGKTRKELQREIVTSTSSETEKKRGIDASVNASVAGPGAKAGISRSSSEHNAESLTQRESETVTEDFYPVRSQSGDRWKVSSKDGMPLDRAFLDDDRLCEVSEVRGANRKGVVSSLAVKEKHLKIELEQRASVFTSPLSTTQQALMRIIIAKSLHERSESGEYSGYVVFSQSTISDEG